MKSNQFSIVYRSNSII